MTTSMDRIPEILQTEDEFLIVSHFNPDGDAIGSMAAMGWILTSLEKRFRMYNVSGMPDRFAWLSMPAPVETELPADKPGWTIVLDCGDSNRVGQDLAKRLGKARVINIDHHQGNPLFGQINWVDTQISSTGEMVAGIAQHLGIPLSGDMGEAIYLALVSDTGWFSYGNTSSQTMELAADIIRQGLRPDIFTPRLNYNWTPSKIRLMGRAMAGARFYSRGKIGVVSASSTDFAKTGATGDDTEGLVDMVRNVGSVVVAVSFREEESRKIKFSLRSTGEVDVRQVAARFGGGGHINASGGVIHASLDSAESQMVKMIQDTLGIKDE
ncbi:DHH family phosphoesterase [Desulfoplanes formicivorans]|uniref:Recombination protein RecJ n=1 Tax=Desulfoplanes formicivorans TaxID=1592317 RepID=A0A194AKN5_9BACT|nr:bifunctional oligoribonuclease/PAP phosphatase NrnA [Desulfoplanes formicivorans]GAU09611.1 recombination protein RecJ [Desulfoplanes formicivorans]